MHLLVKAFRKVTVPLYLWVSSVARLPPLLSEPAVLHTHLSPLPGSTPALGGLCSLYLMCLFGSTMTPALTVGSVNNIKYWAAPWQNEPEDKWSCKRSPDYFPGKTTTVKREKGATSIFLDAQEQPTLWSLIGSGQILNSSKLLCSMSSLLHSQKSDLAKFQTPLSSYACHHYLQVWKGSIKKQLRKSGNTIFSIITLSVAMETSSRIWPNFKLTQALMYVILTSKYDVDRVKNSREKVATTFFPL